MTDAKNTGTYYTPKILSDFLVKHVFSKYLQRDHVSILEPSCGDGQFVSSLLANNVLRDFTSVKLNLLDINPNELGKAAELIRKEKLKNVRVIAKACDYLDYKKTGFSLIIGNPPYINKKRLKKEQIEKCDQICTEIIPEFGETKNIWPSFLLKGIESLNEDGVICFVLPSEILQVNYTREIRKYILNKFERIEIFAFNELIFENIEQDVVVLIGIKHVETEKEKGVSFFHVEKLEDLKIPGYIERHSNVHRKKLDKWTNYVLEDDELNLVEELSSRLNLNSVKSLCKKVEVGIVTAANDYFIVTNEAVKKHKLKPYAKPLIKKGTQIPNSIRVNRARLKTLQDTNKEVNFLHFVSKERKKFSANAKKYFAIGVKKKLNEQYKMGTREHWYAVPSIWVSEGMFIKRSHLFPRIVINTAKVLVTDSFYRINMKKGLHIKNLAFSFYNTVSFILAELEGRFYGGGVLELTPNEFKNILVPYVENISTTQFTVLEKMLSKDETIENILDFTNSILLPNLSEEELSKLALIRKKLVNRRLKVSNKILATDIKENMEFQNVTSPLESVLLPELAEH